MKQNKIINFNVDENIYNQLKRISELQGRTVSELIREGICLIIIKYSKYSIEGGNTSNEK